MESKRIIKHIKNLLLDPNNYRFIDNPSYKEVSENEAADPRVQQRTQNFVVGKNNENISDLIISFKTNGFLDIDQIQVKKVGENYLTLEGNRRVAALKYLYDEFQAGADVGKLTAHDFENVQVVEIFDDAPAQRLTATDLHHSSDKEKWSAVSEAQLIQDLISKQGKTEDEVCNTLGISKQALRRSVRTLAFIEQYKDSDYGDQFQISMYPIFEAAMSNPVVRNWLDWDDDDFAEIYDQRRERFFSWISKSEEIERTENGEEKKVVKAPIITQYRQVKEVAVFINDEKALNKMEESRSLTEGYTFSDAMGRAKLRNTMGNIKNLVEEVGYFSKYMTPVGYREINEIKLKLENIISKSQAHIFINEKKTAKFVDTGTNTNHFTSLHIEQYRKLKKLDVPNLKRINIFVGGNNMGKTSMLEAVYLLSQLNDLSTYFELEKYRGKFLNKLYAVWMDKNFTDAILSGVFNGLLTKLEIKSEITEESIEKSGYLSTILAHAKRAEINVTSDLHLYSNRDLDLRYSSSWILCGAAFTSPYRYNSELLQKAHTAAVKEGDFEKIKTFIKENLDRRILNIELVYEAGENRFMVSVEGEDKPMDLTKYGEGLQRVFEIALLLSYSKGGILCIDEMDSALHTTLLRSFTKFIQQAAQEFNVQVFLSTHSKECIDAFVENGYANEDITAFALTQEGGAITCKYIDGNRLEKLIEAINFDIR